MPGPLEVWTTVREVVRSALSGARRVGVLVATRRRQVIAQVAVLGLLVVAIAGFLARGKTVTLSVDGHSRVVRTTGADVGDLLRDEGVRLSPRDLVAPAVGAELSDGDRVVVRYARRLDLSVDGATRSYWTTELTVEAALAALGIRADGAALSASRSDPIGRTGLALRVWTPKPAVVVADGDRKAVVTTAATIGQLLTEQGITVRERDRLSRPPDTAISSGMVITLDRVDLRRISATEPIPFPVTRKPTPTMVKGETEVITRGVIGSRRAVYDLTVVNGKVTAKSLVSADVLTPARAQVVRVGTKQPPMPSVGSAGGLNWAALARCESGGNPRAVNSAGYYGLYQFSLGTWRSVGGSGNPARQSAAEQTYRAQLLYRRGGAGQWPHCGRLLFS